MEGMEILGQARGSPFKSFVACFARLVLCWKECLRALPLYKPKCPVCQTKSHVSWRVLPGPPGYVCAEKEHGDIRVE
ncbi:MAG: hypothetical protein UX68_C0005G0009 [Parcubacteria group bacterium GW2011_GWA2_46_9]|nr:MAG: hypothetical protein UX68_C0005G0009 [Parcubacteria group bacterium GW2011_GWA2_46_9]